jgi:hypothetical protein
MRTPQEIKHRVRQELTNLRLLLNRPALPKTALSYFRLIPYLDSDRAGDHKWIWELNRHQHLVALGQAFRFVRDPRYTAEIESELRD